MQKGILYLAIKFLLDNLKYINLVEAFKAILVKLNPSQKDLYSRLATDIFIIFKWIFVIALWFTQLTNYYLTFLTWYLIVTNIYTYFYYHIWDDEALDITNYDNDKIRRRFTNLLIAISFSDFCFAYLYRFPYSADFLNSEAGNYIWFSISNSLAANYDVIKPQTDIGNSVAMVQLILTFVFITIIISRSIPQKN